MAIYHFEAKMISRGTGRSAVAAAAYASCSQIYNDYDGITHDYTKKRGNLYSEIFLPPNAPPEWHDRAELWNAVEAAEKSKDSRLARELIVSLPVEVGLNEWRDMLKDFILKNCVDKGMCADVSIHDTDGHNPHAHILLTVRPLDEKGKWQAKTQKEYICKRGDEERGFTADEFKTAKADGWEKQYQYKVGKKKIYMPPSEAEKQGLERVSKSPKSTRYGRQNPICAEWNSDEHIIKWRKAWEDVTNRTLKQKDIDARVDCRSFKERGITEQPTVYEGAATHIMEKRGFVSDRCELNRQIKRDNAIVRELKSLVKELTEKVKNSVPNIAAALENIRSRLLLIHYQLKFNGRQLDRIELEKKTIPVLIKRYKKISAELKSKIFAKKKLQAEKKSCSPINIVKQNQLSKQLAAVTEDIEELKFRKKAVLDDLSCTNEKQVAEAERVFKRHLDSAYRLISRNSELQKEGKFAKSEFVEIRDNIAPEDIEAVQAERLTVRAEHIRKTREVLQDTYGDKYDADIFHEAEAALNDELGEKLSSLNKYLRQKQCKAERTQYSEKKKSQEFEK